MLEKITLDCWKHIQAGKTVWNGYPNGHMTAPGEPGTYTLYQLVDDNNCHAGWEWEKGKCQNGPKN